MAEFRANLCGDWQCDWGLPDGTCLSQPGTAHLQAPPPANTADRFPLQGYEWGSHCLALAGPLPILISNFRGLSSPINTIKILQNSFYGDPPSATLGIFHSTLPRDCYPVGTGPTCVSSSRVSAHSLPPAENTVCFPTSSV